MTAALTPPKKTRPRPRTFVLSDRLAKGLELAASGRESSKASAIAYGISLLESNPDMIVVEGIGVSEKKIRETYPDLGEDTQARIQTLADAHSNGLRSMVVRAAIEALIEHYGIVEARRPEGWESKPIGFSVSGNSPVEKLSEPTWTTSACFPAVLWQQLESLVQPRGQAHLKQVSLSGFLRQAIDSADPKTLHNYIIPHPPQRNWLKAQTEPQSLTLYRAHGAWLGKLQAKLEKHGVTTRQATIAAIANQAIANKTVKVKLPKPIPLPKKLARAWQVFCETGNIVEASDIAGLSLEDTAKAMAEHKLIISYTSPTLPPGGGRPSPSDLATTEAIVAFLKGGQHRTIADVVEHFQISASTAHRRIPDEVKVSLGIRVHSKIALDVKPEQVAHLVDDLGYTRAQTAKALDISESTVNRRLQEYDEEQERLIQEAKKKKKKG